VTFKNENDILAILKTITDPVSGKNIVDAGLVNALSFTDNSVRLALEIEAANADKMEPVRLLAEARLKAREGIENVMVSMVAHNEKSEPPKMNAKQSQPRSSAQNIPGVKHVVAIASGKGGVGKSTLSINIAAALASKGIKTGLLDADVYGPSQPLMMNIHARPSSPDGKTIIPLRNHGITMMSIGLMMEAGKAVIWRGPMLMGALQQMMFQVEWGELDILIVDLPPGTGDVQLTLAQKAHVSGAVIVSTPQDIALIDARKAIDMFGQLDVPILGLVENMSTHVCSNCGHEEHIFGHGGVATEAQNMDVDLLSEIPLDIAIRLAGDSGTPAVLSDPSSQYATAFQTIADKITHQLSIS